MTTAILTFIALTGGTMKIPYPLLGVERLGNGNTVITEAGDPGRSNARITEVDSLGQVVWAYLKSDIPLAHTARRLARSRTLITASSGNRVIEVDSAGNTVWSLDAGLRYPNEAYRLGNGNTLITDRDNNRAVEVMTDGTEVWSYTDLVGPHNCTRLGNGNSLVCDSDRNRVIEIAPWGAVVWSYSTELYWPRCAQRLANGNTLITSSTNYQILEVDGSGTVVWQYSTMPDVPYMATRLGNRHTLISCQTRVFELDSLDQVVWHWPGTFPVQVDTFAVFNPASGCSLNIHVHYAPEFASRARLPAVVLVPDGVLPGSAFDTSGLADDIAAEGFAALHFDCDGRGASDSFPENFYGDTNQVGLAACIQALARSSIVDTSRIGIISEGYGITLAAGMLVRHPASAPVRFLVDLEGPADRYQSSADSGGSVPVPVDSSGFWEQREAVADMSRIECAYLRVQTDRDRNPRIRDNRHCIALIDSATLGRARWTRVNDSLMNSPNRSYTIEDHPVWIPDIEELHTGVRYLLYLRELSGPGTPSSILEAESRPGDRQPVVGLASRPNPAEHTVRISFHLPRSAEVALGIFDNCGRLVQSPHCGPMAAGPQTCVWNCRDQNGRIVAPGVYFVRLRADGSSYTGKIIKE